MPMTNAVDGFYVGGFTGVAGNGLGLFVFRDGTIVGVDVLGVRFDGTYQLTEDKESFAIAVTVTAPPGGQLVQGVPTGTTGLTYHVTTTVPINFENTDFLTLPTPYGEVRARLKKLRGLS